MRHLILFVRKGCEHRTVDIRVSPAYGRRVRMRDFPTFAKLILRKRKFFHLAILLISLIMIPGLIKSLTPIDIESYDLESPELAAEHVIDEGFTSTEHTVGFMVTIRDPQYIESGSQAPPCCLIFLGLQNSLNFREKEPVYRVKEYHWVG